MRLVLLCILLAIPLTACDEPDGPRPGGQAPAPAPSPDRSAVSGSYVLDRRADLQALAKLLHERGCEELATEFKTLGAAATATVTLNADGTAEFESGMSSPTLPRSPLRGTWQTLDGNRVEVLWTVAVPGVEYQPGAGDPIRVLYDYLPTLRERDAESGAVGAYFRAR